MWLTMPQNDMSRAHAALRLAVWRNDLQAAEALLASGVAIDSLDEESRWSCLHYAFYWGHMAMGVRILQAGASLHTVDDKGRTPVDILSAQLKAHQKDTTCPEVFSWGNGANYQLGTGGTGLATAPVRLEDLRGRVVSAVSAAKFHSAACTAEGRLLTWGWGRGGRLGHGEFDVHSGEVATIAPRVVAALERHVVVSVAAAKHHTVCLTSAGEVWTWGSNRHCQLGYSVDSQPTPRKITTVRARVAAVAAAGKHTVVVTEGGAVFTWGDNSQGQLGYGTCDSAANSLPRIVEAMKGRRVTAVAAAKRHTVALTSEGDIWTWGHCHVSPHRVQLAGSRDVLRADGSELVFHKGQSRVGRPVAARIAAGAAHSSCITTDGVLLTWRSGDPELQPQQVGGALAGHIIIDISAGKYRTAAVTEEGDVFMFEGWSKATEAHAAATMGRGRTSVSSCGNGGASLMGTSPQLPSLSGTSPGTTANVQRRQRNRWRAAQLAHQIVAVRVEGLKRVTSAAVGEKHSIAMQAWCSEPLSSWPLDDRCGGGDGGEDSLLSGWGNQFPTHLHVSPQRPFPRDEAQGVASLQRLCEREVALSLVEPRTVCDVLQYADASDAGELRRHCLAMLAANLDCVVLEARPALECLPDHLLSDLGLLLRRRHSGASAAEGPTSHFHNTRPTAHAGGSGDSGDAAGGSYAEAMVGEPLGRERSFLSDATASETAAISRQIRHLTKKLQQIDSLRARGLAGRSPLDAQQTAKVGTRPAVAAALDALLSGASLASAQELLPATSSVKLISAASWHDMPRHLEKSASRSYTDTNQAVFAASHVGNRAPPASSSAIANQSHVPDCIDHQQTQTQIQTQTQTQQQSCAVVPHGAMSSTSGFDVAASPRAAAVDAQSAPTAASKVGSGKGGRKGGLSMFLRGELEQLPIGPSSRQLSKLPSKPFAWGQSAAPSPAAVRHSAERGAHVLRSQLPQLSQLSSVGTMVTGGRCAIKSGRSRQEAGSSCQTASTGSLMGRDLQQVAQPEGKRTLPLAEFMRSTLRSVPSRAAVSVPSPESAAWGGIGASPPSAGAPSLRQIQEQEAQWNHRKSTTAGRTTAAGTSPQSASPARWRLLHQASPAPATSPGSLFPSGTSPSSYTRRAPQQTGVPNSKWFITEDRQVTPLRQIERQETEAAAAAAEELQVQQAISAAAALERKAAKALRRKEAKARACAAATAASTAAELDTREDALPQHTPPRQRKQQPPRGPRRKPSVEVPGSSAGGSRRAVSAAAQRAGSNALLPAPSEPFVVAFSSHLCCSTPSRHPNSSLKGARRKPGSSRAVRNSKAHVKHPPVVDGDNDSNGRRRPHRADTPTPERSQQPLGLCKEKSDSLTARPSEVVSHSATEP